MDVSLSHRLASLELAKALIGIHETRENDSPLIRIMLRNAGIKTPAPWCAAFVQWCADVAARMLTAAGIPTSNPLDNVQFEALVADYVATAKRRGWIVKAPGAGDLFAIDYGSGRGHIGFVAAVRAEGLIETVEGNTNADGSREGTHVLSRIRRPTNAYTFIRYQ